MDRLIAHPHLRVATVPFPCLGIAVAESRKEAAVRGSLLVSLPRVLRASGPQKVHLCGEPGVSGLHAQRLPCLRGFFFASPPLSLFSRLLFSPSSSLVACCCCCCCYYQFSQTETASATKWAEDRALRDRCIPWSWSWCWRLGSMVIITPKSDPNTHLVTLSWSVWGSRYEGESPKG
ncbi:hypothetical protein J3F84DRAFT_364910 [Trichoderma pleuroticola]